MAVGRAWQFLNRVYYKPNAGEQTKDSLRIDSYLRSYAKNFDYDILKNTYKFSWDTTARKVILSNDIDIDRTIFNKIVPKIDDSWKLRKLKEEKLPSVLFPFQKESVKFLDAKKGNALIGHDMGLGKTIISIAYLMLRQQRRPALIICPASLKYNWQDEILKWTNTDPNIKVITTANDLTLDLSKYEYVIVNYEMLSRQIIKKTGMKGYARYYQNDIIKEFAENNKFKQIIIDECHRIKDAASQTYRAVKFLKENCCNDLIAVSGTPILAKPDEFWTVLNLLDPVEFKSQYHFRNRYCAPNKDSYGITYNGAKHTKELHQRVQPYMIRYTKEQVLPELPKKLRRIIPVDLKKGEYNAIHEYIKIRCSESNSGVPGLGELHEIQNMLYHAKKKNIFEYIDNMVASGEKIVVFYTHTEAINEAEKKYKNICVKVDGTVKAINRKKAIDKFQNDPKIKVFLGNLDAAGVGLTLTAASTVLFAETGFISPGEIEQAEDRCCRIGTTASHVDVTFIVGKDTVEELFVKIIASKKAKVDAILKGKNIKDSNEYKEMFEKYIDLLLNM